MKRKISVILIILVMTIAWLVGHAFAVSKSDVKLSVFVSPSNPGRGDEVTITVSLSELKVGVSSVSFAFNYDKAVFEDVKATASIGWTSTLTGTTYFINTDNLEDTTQTGTILTISLKVKSNAQVGTQSNISFTSIQASAGRDLINDFENLSRTITISSNGQGGNEVHGGNTTGNETTENPTRNEVTGDPTKNEVTGNDVTDNPTRNEVTGNDDNGNGNGGNGNGATGGNGEPVVNTLPVQKINEIGNYTTADKETPKIPQTGENYAIQISIIGLTILSIVSYVIYRKNKI